MSNSSDSPDDTGLSPTSIGRLWKSLASEWQSIAAEIARLGAELSRLAELKSDVGLVADMQQFDLLHQQTLAQAELMLRLVESSPTAASEGQCQALIDAIPFEHVRNRLTAAMTGNESHTTSEDAVEGEVFWL